MVAKVLKIVPGSDWAKEKLETTTLSPCTSCTSWLVWNCPIGLIKKKKGTKGPEVTFTSQVTSAPVIAFLSAAFSGVGNLTEPVSNNGLQFPSLKSPFSWGKPWCTADPQHAAVRTTEKSSAWLWKSVYRSIGRKGKCRKSPLWTSHVRM